MTTTYKGYFEFIAVANNYLANNKEETKLKYAIERVARLNKTIYNDFQEDVESLRIDFCEKDEKGIILRNEKGGYLWTAKGTKEFNAACKELENKIIEVQTHKCDISGFILNEEEVEVFSKFLI
jgi:hypothetical protein